METSANKWRNLIGSFVHGLVEVARLCPPEMWRMGRNNLLLLVNLVIISIFEESVILRRSLGSRLKFDLTDRRAARRPRVVARPKSLPFPFQERKVEN